MDFDTLILGVATLLFVIALVALLVWAFKTFFGKSSTSNFLRAREKRLGIVETATVDAKRKLYLLRRDDMEHLVMIGGARGYGCGDGNQRAPASGPAP